MTVDKILSLTTIDLSRSSLTQTWLSPPVWVGPQRRTGKTSRSRRSRVVFASLRMMQDVVKGSKQDSDSDNPLKRRVLVHVTYSTCETRLQDFNVYFEQRMADNARADEFYWMEVEGYVRELSWQTL